MTDAQTNINPSLTHFCVLRNKSSFGNNFRHNSHFIVVYLKKITNHEIAVIINDSYTTHTGSAKTNMDEYSSITITDW